MKIDNVRVQQFGSGVVPDGISADVILESGIELWAYRDWDNPQWYLYDISFGDKMAKIRDVDQNYPIPVGEVTNALNSAVESIRSEYSPA